MNRKMLISLTLGTLVSAAALFLAFRNVPFRALGAYLATVNYLWILPATAVMLISFALRALRWQIILGPARGVNFWQCFHPMMIGFMINCILPGRVGEVARPAILQRKHQVAFSTGLATVAAERVFDMALIFCFFAIVATFVNIDPSQDMVFGAYHLNAHTLNSLGRGIAELCVALVAAIVAISIDSFRRQLIRIIEALPRLCPFLGPIWNQRLRRFLVFPMIRLLENIAVGFSMVRDPRKLVVCTGLSVLIWTLMVLSYFVLAAGSPGIEHLSFLEIAAVMVMVCFFIALPSVPGFWGLWEAGGVFALSLFGVSGKDAAGYTLLNHAVQVFPVILVGLASAMITGVNIGQVSGPLRKEGAINDRR
jgi:uncharacterized protein (TIRG00374 family)